MLLPPLLLLLLLPLTLLWWQKSRRVRKTWGHRAALRALGWAAAWAKWRLEESTRQVHQSQKQTLQRCLRGPQRATCPRGEIPDLDGFRNQFPLIRPCLDPHSKTGGSDEGLAKLQHPPFNPTLWESSLQAMLLSFNSLKETYPGALVPGGTARLTLTSPWPCSLPWPLRPLDWACPPGADAGDPRTLLLAALGTRDLQVLEAGTATELLDVFCCLGADWEGLVEAVAAGQPGFSPPAPNRAAELKTELEQGPQGLVRRLWPQLQVVVTMDAGGQDVAKAALGATWCQGLPFFSPAYVAAGGMIGLNLCPKQQKPDYLLLPGPPFVELLPAWERSQEEAPRTLLLGEALRGKEYELVLTGGARLTRCPLGDVVQVIDFYNQCPVVRFVRRLGQSLNVRGEGISEDVFSGALLCAVGLWPGAKLLDYCCAESSIVGSFSDASAPHYEVFVELRGVRGLSEDHRHKLDHCLQEASPTYKSLRFRGSIGPAQVHLVGQGGFRELRTLLSSSPSFMPFSSFPPEMPRILKQRDLVQFLLRKVVS
ncbi:GH3 domain-containing protein [Antechinus flavipes]|uniref:GH3 domain-containing protein n=1 Tax=Antechinus flavipes TaxID=38775 RepID=UPI002235EC7F|nr:GH3 domain-containing protein [Antechinus flavipes]XP_051850403.1 GH3 domain-containing protein [Antechinus flavipes]XP_051850404.1 GH3 domain-containing protein [Antechinus flavipes]XP_051850405.1 GH3 domain-containing protein [Antechinus flavipes]